MCGIAGIIDIKTVPRSEDIGAMIAKVAYRGPDGVGQICLDSDGVALGHRRLSILDLSPAGSQPMVSGSGRLWVVFNGEIYNYLEIRRDLEVLGCTFRSGSDTEVLLYAYEQWGPACLERFMGMYAFAIWDREKRELFAARDRLGIKPLYYRETAHGLHFASEIKSILAVQTDPRGVDASLIDAYMNFGYVPGEQTLHKGIKRLLPGHTLTWRDNKTKISSYWDLRFGEQGLGEIDDCADRINGLLKDSIALHLRSDVPLGVFLSGGLDSSAVVALLSPGASSGLKTFSVAYDFGPDYDETPYAREVAATFSTDHHEIRITPQQFLDFVPSYIWHMDEPVTEAAAISLYYVSKLAREHVVVCLSGEGSDELFGGYDFYTYNLAIEKARRIFGAGFFRKLTGLAAKVRRFAKLRKYLELAGRPLEERYRGISSYEPGKKSGLYSRGFAGCAAEGNAGCSAFIEGIFTRSQNWDALSRMLYFDMKTWLVDDLLIKADRMSMANSIELRVPFLDHRLVEYAATVSSRYKIRGTDTKFIFKKSMEGKLPQRIVQRRKMGFPTPLEIMFRGELYDYAHDTLLSSQAAGRGYFDTEAVKRLLLEHRSSRAANHREIWQLLVLEEWHRRFGY
ncbi:MAG: asparagine synthase (glutamine-hydrolyzing) [Sulfuricaulis sp.]